ncbi:MAG: nitrogen fixation protein NifZ [Synechococcaceae cyanobacterium RM1_1_27]|nr:nitrogen fixation protein NifZ [Synechococcaceae cyanobacterium RM1_1_27]
MTTEENELEQRPLFELGDKVRICQTIRNDGTYFGEARGTILAIPGDEGYVVYIGTFLQRFYIYAVHSLAKGFIVGCRAKELKLLEKNS